MPTLVRRVDNNPAQLERVICCYFLYTGLRKVTEPIFFRLIFDGCSCGESVVVGNRQEEISTGHAAGQADRINASASLDKLDKLFSLTIRQFGRF